MNNRYLFLLYIIVQNIEVLRTYKINTILGRRRQSFKGRSLGAGFCQTKKDPGLCDKQIPMYYYDSQDNQCYFFLYTGCGGNDNRFPTLAACQQTCVKCAPVSCPPGCVRFAPRGGCPKCTCKQDYAAGANICMQDQRRGYCRALYHKWAFDKKTKTCVQFVYGGCGGNGNNFETKAQCELVCKNM